MGFFSWKFIGVLLSSLTLYSFSSLPSIASSSLAAWIIRSDGVLQFRTSHDAKLKSFFKRGDDLIGDRIWIDFQGELTRPRALPGNGPIREIRLGKPKRGITRLVIEFDHSVSLDPYKLKIKGLASDKWQLDFVGLPVETLKSIGEGDVNKSISKRLHSDSSSATNKFFISLNVNNLPNVKRGKYLVIIDPGHGGPDPGAIGINGLRESEIVLDVSKQVKAYLSQKGVSTRLTRAIEKDLDLPPRVVLANKLKANAFVSIHANASRGYRKDINGLETYYFSKYGGGLTLAKDIHNEILKASPESPDRGVRKGSFFVIRRTNMPAALVEIGFVTGLNDSRDLSRANHRKRLAFAISNGILKYLKKLD